MHAIFFVRANSANSSLNDGQGNLTLEGTNDRISQWLVWEEHKADPDRNNKVCSGLARHPEGTCSYVHSHRRDGSFQEFVSM